MSRSHVAAVIRSAGRTVRMTSIGGMNRRYGNRRVDDEGMYGVASGWHAYPFLLCVTVV